MRRLLTTASAVVVLALLAVPASALSSHTFVSGVGDDANPCTRTAPCQTFAGTITQTGAGGTVECLDPGEFGSGIAAIFKPVTITQSVTIDCEKTTGSFLTVGGVNGISVAGAGVVVNLRGLSIMGGGTGLIGVNVTQSATVYIRNSYISGFQGGAATEISFTGGGTLVVEKTAINLNGTGIALSGSGGNVNMTLRNIIVHGNSANGVSITTSGSNALAMIDHSTLAFNATGLNVSGSAAIVRIGNSTVTGNATGVAVASGSLYSFKENQIAGNTTDGTPVTAFPGPGGPLQ